MAPPLVKKSLEIKTFQITFSIFLLYVSMRLLGWHNVLVLEGTDSIYYLESIKVFLTFQLDEIINLNPDHTPFYLFFSALFSLPGWSVETGARLCSLIFSLLLFWFIVGIGKQFTKPLEIYLGLLLISLSPALVSLSYAVRTEPAYIAVVYCGFWIFWTQYQRPSLWKAALLGFIFGLAFLNRLEGILYLAVIPFLQLAHYFLHKQKNYKLKHLIGWAAIFIALYSATAAPQIWRVSNIMGEPSLNGRTVWSVILNNPDGKSYWGKIYGLDYSESTLNIDYLQHNPEIRHEMQQAIGDQNLLDGYFKTIKFNIRDLLNSKISELFGWVTVIFFMIGLFALYKYRRFYELLLVCSFIIVGMIAPLLHNVVIRHIAVIAPLILLISAVGIVYFASSIKEKIRANLIHTTALSLLITLLLVGPLVLQFNNIFSPKMTPTSRAMNNFKEPIRLIQKIVDEELHRKAVICAQKPLLAYYAGGEIVRTPFSKLPALIKYIELNNVDFLYLDHRRLEKRKFPFLDENLAKKLPSNYTLIYRNLSEDNKKIELYRIEKQSL